CPHELIETAAIGDSGELELVRVENRAHGHRGRVEHVGGRPLLVVAELVRQQSAVAAFRAQPAGHDQCVCGGPGGRWVDLHLYTLFPRPSERRAAQWCRRRRERAARRRDCARAVCGGPGGRWVDLHLYTLFPRPSERRAAQWCRRRRERAARRRDCARAVCGALDPPEEDTARADATGQVTQRVLEIAQVSECNPL